MKLPYDGLVVGYLLKGGSSEVKHVLKTVMDNASTCAACSWWCDLDFHTCQWREPGAPFLFYEQPGKPRAWRMSDGYDLRLESFETVANATLRALGPAELARLHGMPVVRTDVSYFAPQHRRFRIVVVREPCAYAASVWKYARHAGHGSAAGRCVEQLTSGTSLGLVQPQNVTHRHHLILGADWHAFVLRTGAAHMHWLGFRLRMLLRGFDYEDWFPFCASRDAASGNDGPCELDDYALCPYLASPRLVHRLTDTSPGGGGGSGAGGREDEPGIESLLRSADCWVRLESLLTDVSRCMRVYHERQLGRSTLRLHAALEALEDAVAGAAVEGGATPTSPRAGAGATHTPQGVAPPQGHRTHHMNQNSDCCACEEMFGLPAASPASKANLPSADEAARLRSAVYSRDGGLAHALGYSGCCSGAASAPTS